ncbi:OmpH family outer membrane protein [uncultured Alistipes sp.]|uniref:OmpH family outer membrane protein n=1 Tax=uncultured Alistipes sp. TaxID=538949 RepID=UPI00266B71D7|nr:OmpH family outer membrane protein [uncultured Alistipes sp.]
MKKFFFPVLAAALVLTACGTKTTETSAEAAATETATAQQVGTGDIAYVQVEAVLAQCDLFLNEGKALQEKTEKAQKSWAQREQNLQAEAAQLQEKYQKGLITTRDAQATQESIQKRVASYQANAQKEAQSLDEENYVFTNRAQDLLHRAVQEINADKRYKLIVNASALIDADTTLDITAAVLAKVNELYAADKKAESKK